MCLSGKMTVCNRNYYYNMDILYIYNRNYGIIIGFVAILIMCGTFHFWQNVTNTFTRTALSDRCTFLGNVRVGSDVPLTDLLNSYMAVVLVS